MHAQKKYLSFASCIKFNSLVLILLPPLILEIFIFSVWWTWNKLKPYEQKIPRKENNILYTPSFNTQEESCFTSNRNSSRNIYFDFLKKWREIQFFTFCACVVANIYDELVIKMSGGDQPLETSYGRVILKKFLQK